MIDRLHFGLGLAALAIALLALGHAFYEETWPRLALDLATTVAFGAVAVLYVWAARTGMRP